MVGTVGSAFAASACVYINPCDIFPGLCVPITPSNVVQDGSFELPALPLDTPFATPGVDATSITGWAVGSGSVDLVSHGMSGALAGDGAQFVDLSGNGAGSISQTLTTTPGAVYTLSWLQAANPDNTCDTATKHLSVSWDGNVVDTETPSAAEGETWSSLNWVSKSVQVTAPNASTVLSFASGDACAYGPLLDNVSTTLLANLPQTISFGSLSPITYSPDEQLTLTGSSDSGLPVTYSTSGPCSVNGTTLSVSGAGSCVITANQIGNVSYAAATAVQQVLTINKATQSIEAYLPSSLTYQPGEDFSIDSWSTSDGPISFSTSGPCSVVDGELLISGAGTCSVTAVQPGTSNYLFAKIVRTVQIARERTVLTAYGASQTSLTRQVQSTGASTLTARLTAGYAGVLNTVVTFADVNGTTLCLSRTDSYGYATCSVSRSRVNQLLLTHQWSASFGGTQNLLPSIASSFIS